MDGSGDGPTSGPTNGDPGQREPPSPKAAPRYSATFDPWTMSEIRRAAATGIYDIRGAGAKRPCPTSTTCCSSARRSRATRSRATESAAAPT